MSKKVKISFEQLEAAMSSDDHIGFCLACGFEQGGCEPDARNYECESCERPMVFGAEEILMTGGY